MKPLTLILLVFLTACAPALPTPPPITPPVIWQVQVTPGLNWMSAYFNRCAQEQYGVHLVVLERPAPALDLNTADVALRWGAPPQLSAPAVVLGEDELVFIVHPSNPLTQINLVDLRSLLGGKISTWEKLAPGAGKEPIKVYTFAAGDDLQQVLDAALPNLPANRETGWLAPDPAAVRQAVAAAPAAIGSIPKRWLDSTVKAIKISDLPSPSLRQPILAITKTQPSEPLKAWLACLQGAIK